MVIVYAALIACLIFAHLLIYCLVKSGIAESKKPAPLSARQRRLVPSMKFLQLCLATNKKRSRIAFQREENCVGIPQRFVENSSCCCCAGVSLRLGHISSKTPCCVLGPYSPGNTLHNAAPPLQNWGPQSYGETVMRAHAWVAIASPKQRPMLMWISFPAGRSCCHTSACSSTSAPLRCDSVETCTTGTSSFCMKLLHLDACANTV